MDTLYTMAATEGRDPVDRYLDSIRMLDGKVFRIISSQRAFANDLQRIAESLRLLADGHRSVPIRGRGSFPVPRAASL